jgi:hypothetical protein
MVRAARDVAVGGARRRNSHRRYLLDTLAPVQYTPRRPHPRSTIMSWALIATFAVSGCWQAWRTARLGGGVIAAFCATHRRRAQQRRNDPVPRGLARSADVARDSGQRRHRRGVVRRAADARSCRYGRRKPSVPRSAGQPRQFTARRDRTRRAPDRAKAAAPRPLSVETPALAHVLAGLAIALASVVRSSLHNRGQVMPAMIS